MDWNSLYKHTKTFLKSVKREILKPEIHESYLSDIQTGGSKKKQKRKKTYKKRKTKTRKKKSRQLVRTSSYYNFFN